MIKCKINIEKSLQFWRQRTCKQGECSWSLTTRVQKSWIIVTHLLYSYSAASHLDIYFGIRELLFFWRRSKHTDEIRTHRDIFQLQISIQVILKWTEMFSVRELHIIFPLFLFSPLSIGLWFWIGHVYLHWCNWRWFWLVEIKCLNTVHWYWTNCGSHNWNR